ncbi:2'-5' RNA ligase family protein [Actinoplanes italicus]|uniref:2'-5' RNA ligase family protein n=1 Tax=Actinoplanes italicus TaxID=113567 RepID=UPI001EF316C8|nr:2'-5' RNA ligase family protein [Actinoplanes italicus]
MTVLTIELLLDDRLESAVRDLWESLHAAGLRSLATHRHPTNRPHITLVTTGSLDDLPGLDLPLPVTLGPVHLLGRALVRPAESPELRLLHALVWRSAGSINPLYEPSAWVPHVSLALNLPVPQRSDALALLAGLPPLSGHCVAARSYDTEARTVHEL